MLYGATTKVTTESYSPYIRFCPKMNHKCGGDIFQYHREIVKIKCQFLFRKTMLLHNIYTVKPDTKEVRHRIYHTHLQLQQFIIHLQSA